MRRPSGNEINAFSDVVCHDRGPWPITHVRIGPVDKVPVEDEPVALWLGDIAIDLSVERRQLERGEVAALHLHDGHRTAGDRIQPVELDLGFVPGLLRIKERDGEVGFRNGDENRGHDVLVDRFHLDRDAVDLKGLADLGQVAELLGHQTADRRGNAGPLHVDPVLGLVQAKSAREADPTVGQGHRVVLLLGELIDYSR